MFDDEKTPGQAPGNLPFAPTPSAPPSSSLGQQSPNALDAGLLRRKEDIASEEVATSNSPQSGIYGNSVVPPMSPVMPMTYTTKEPVLGKILAGLLTIVGIGVVGVGGWYAYNRIIAPVITGVQKNTPSSSATVETVSSSQQAAGTATATYQPSFTTTSLQNATNNETLLFGEQVDTDGDGLPDRRERDVGTDPDNADSDRDQLSDGEEILLGTDPRNPDSDGDGFPDGREVLNGYSPLGPGRLFSTTSFSEKATSTDMMRTSTISPVVTPNIPSL